MEVENLDDLFDPVHVEGSVLQFPEESPEDAKPQERQEPVKRGRSRAAIFLGVCLVLCVAAVAAYSLFYLAPSSATGAIVPSRVTESSSPSSGSSSNKVHPRKTALKPSDIAYNEKQELEKFVAECCPHIPELCPTQAMGDLTLPAEYCLRRYATSVSGARMLLVIQDPDLGQVTFVGTVQGGLFALVDPQTNGTVSHMVTLASGRVSPHGVDMRNGALYVAEREGLSRIDNVMRYVAEDTTAPMHRMHSGWDPNGHHGQRVLRFGPEPNENGLLYIAIGVPCNTCRPEELSCPKENCHYGDIITVEVDGKDELQESDFEVFVTGSRNSEGFDFHPNTGELWFTDNGRDHWGNDRPADELNRVTAAGQHFGFPFCYGYTDADMDFASDPQDCIDGDYQPAAVELGPHIAALGMRFYQPGSTGSFPAPYNEGIFIAEHGSWNRNPFLGFRVTFVPVTQGKHSLEVGDYEIFLDGFLTNPNIGTRFGRPSDVAFLDDGSLIFSDDHGSVVYHVYHSSDQDMFEEEEE